MNFPPNKGRFHSASILFSRVYIQHSDRKNDGCFSLFPFFFFFEEEKRQRNRGLGAKKHRLLLLPSPHIFSSPSSTGIRKDTLVQLKAHLLLRKKKRKTRE